MSSSEPLAVLAIDQRNQLESLLMEFDSEWSPELLGDYRGQLASAESQVFRKLAVTELVKIDLHRSWSSGQGKLLEEYCHKIPDLGDAKSVDPDLILVEFAARRSVEPDLELQSYAFRFPNQFDQLASRADQFLESNAVAGRDSSEGPDGSRRNGRGEGPDGSRRNAGREEDGEEAQDGSERAQASIDTSRVGDARDTQANRSAQATTLPKEFGRYRIVRELGAGAMGTVYLARDTQLDRDVALKTPSFSGDKDDELVTRFYREAKAAAKIDHRNICPIHDVGEIDGRHFISMAFVKGRCMSEYLRGDKLPPQKTSAILIHRLALALAEAHHHKVVHRDLKPANIMINAKHEPVVMDFGLARQTDVESRMTQSGMIVGTPAYMSPEQISGENDEVTPQVDIYALGVILYEMLTGKLPFRGAIAQVVHQIINKEPVPPSKLRDGIDPELESICARMMAKDRVERYQSMDDVAAALKEYLQGKESKKEKRPEDDSRPKEVLQASTETGALNAFFLAQGSKVLDREPSALASGNSSDNSALPETPVPTPAASACGSVERQTEPSRGGTGFPLKSIAAGFAGALIVLFGIVYLVKTPYGILRVQTYGELADLEVLVDGDTVSLTQSQSVTATDHQFALKLGGAELKFDPTTNQFVMTGGDERRLTVTINDLQLSSKRFTITKNTEAILEIELLPLPDAVATAVEPNVRDSVAGVGSRSSPLSESPNEQTPASNRDPIAAKVHTDGDPRSIDRLVAERVKLRGGSTYARFVDDGRILRVKRDVAIPSEPFHVTQIDFRKRHSITSDDMELFSQLQHLLRMNHFQSGVSDAGLEHFEGNDSLTELIVRDHGVVTDRGIASIGTFSKLNYLQLRCHKVTDEGLSHLAKLEELRYLSLDNTNVRGPGLVHLQDLPKLTVLGLEGTKLTVDGLSTLAGLTQLESLGLNRSTIRDPELKYLVNLRSLSYLVLSATSVTDEGLKTLGTMSQLVNLHLVGTSVTDEGIAHLTGLRQLQVIDLTNTQVTDASVEHLRQLRSLQAIYLKDTRFTDEAIAELRKSLPKCKVYVDTPPPLESEDETDN